MTPIPISYADARPRMKPGDVIAFSGKGHFSEIIKLATLSDVSHVGVILQTQMVGDDEDRFFNQIIESATVRGFSGVSASRLSERLADYDGNIWWLPIRMNLKVEIEKYKAFYNFLFKQAALRKPYDLPQALLSAVDILEHTALEDDMPGYNREDFEKFFCSELVAAGLEVAGVVPRINASEVTPIDLCRWNIYEQDYYVLKGEGQPKISRFNRLDPGLWDV
ncbi:MAG: hypothetical protein EP335_01280 [Alphaproteobacteria bacterium]|nr:MAG: hypothetical protein EP335_01280 [Alphaproteobacteria bacterium]